MSLAGEIRQQAAIQRADGHGGVEVSRPADAAGGWAIVAVLGMIKRKLHDSRKTQTWSDGEALEQELVN